VCEGACARARARGTRGALCSTGGRVCEQRQPNDATRTRKCDAVGEAVCDVTRTRTERQKVTLPAKVNHSKVTQPNRAGQPDPFPRGGGVLKGAWGAGQRPRAQEPCERSEANEVSGHGFGTRGRCQPPTTTLSEAHNMVRVPHPAGCMAGCDTRPSWLSPRTGVGGAQHPAGKKTSPSLASSKRRHGAQRKSRQGTFMDFARIPGAVTERRHLVVDPRRRPKAPHSRLRAGRFHIRKRDGSVRPVVVKSSLFSKLANHQRVSKRRANWRFTSVN
jgi:hypothetical protein